MWLDQLAPPVRSQAADLSRLVHRADGGIAEAIKWHRLTFTVRGNWHHWLCAVLVKRNGAWLLFHKGALLDDPHELLEGSGNYLRETPYRRVVADPSAALALVREAIAHQTDL